MASITRVDSWLAEHAITFAAELIGSNCPRFCDDARKNVDMGKVNSFPRKSHVHGKHYRVTFQRKGPWSGSGVMPNVDKSLVIDFWNSYADEETLALGTRQYREGEYAMKYGFKNTGKPRVTAYDVLSCIEKNMLGTFEEFCSDFGYDSDSRRAEDTYRAVVEESKRVRAFFTAEEISWLEENAQ